LRPEKKRFSNARYFGGVLHVEEETLRIGGHPRRGSRMPRVLACASSKSLGSEPSFSARFPSSVGILLEHHAHEHSLQLQWNTRAKATLVGRTSRLILKCRAQKRESLAPRARSPVTVVQLFPLVCARDSRRSRLGGSGEYRAITNYPLIILLRCAQATQTDAQKDRHLPNS
jgi:hypothetical protein